MPEIQAKHPKIAHSEGFFAVSPTQIHILLAILRAAPLEQKANIRAMSMPENPRSRCPVPVARAPSPRSNPPGWPLCPQNRTRMCEIADRSATGRFRQGPGTPSVDGGRQARPQNRSLRLPERVITPPQARTSPNRPRASSFKPDRRPTEPENRPTSRLPEYRKSPAPDAARCCKQSPCCRTAHTYTCRNHPCPRRTGTPGSAR